LLYQGGLSTGRQLEALVSAMALVQVTGVHLVILGDGPLQPALQKLAVAPGAQGRVHLHPAVPQSELLAWTAAADAGVIPYQPTCLNNLYCTPNKLFEFIAAGLPILASDLPEIRAIVAGHGIGQLADLSSPSAIAAAIDRFFADRRQLAIWRDASQKARGILNWDEEGRKVVRVFKGLR
jgi:glycosyltransferase involved in cell wall biosynthesis